MGLKIAALRQRLRSLRQSRWFPYVLPLIAVFAAMLLNLAVVLVVGTKSDFPVAFFYLIAVFAAAWLGGRTSGILACLVTMVGLPLAVTHELMLKNLDLVRLIMLVGVSLLISWVAEAQRRMQQKLRESNEELDRRVEIRTSELAQTVALVRSEVEERKRTESALRESEQRVDMTLDAAGIGRWDLDLASGRIARSPRHDQIFGYENPPQEWTCRVLLNHIHPDDRAGVRESFHETLATGDLFEIDTRIVRADGEVRWVWILGKVLRHESGAPVSVLGSLREITRRKVAEDRVHTQLARMNLLDSITRGIGERQDLSSIFQVVVGSLEENLPIDFGSICLYDKAAGFLQVACAGARSQDLAAKMGMGETSKIPIDANGLSRCVGGHLVYEPDVAELNFPFPERLARGGLRSLVAAPLLVANEVFGILIAARKQSHAFMSGDCEFLRQLSEHIALASNQAQIRSALQEAYDELSKSQQTVLQQERLRALGQMASGIAHDINNAVSPVALYTESLLENEPNLSARTRRYLETTQRAIEDVAETVARMREFYRPQEPQRVLTQVDAGLLVQQVLDLTHVHWSDMAQRRGVTIEVHTDLAPGLPAISAIESEIREALTNLVINAVDAMPSGGMLTVRTKSIDNPFASPEVHLEVSDTGIGMDEDTRRRCLEPFFTTKGERGTGLGLAMVYGVAQRHNAEVQIDSIPGEGTTARLVFPVPAPAISMVEAAPAEKRYPQSLRILVIDDDPLLLKSLHDTLEANGHKVTMANGGNEGVGVFRAALAGEKFSVVITDLGMPYMDGRKVASAIKAASPETPVILLTGWGQRLVAEGDVPPDVDRVLSKPPKLQHLRAALAECVAEPATIRPVPDPVLTSN